MTDKPITSLGYGLLLAKAHENGLAKAQATIPTPMTVIQHANPLDDDSPINQTWHVPQGVCGFAWINIKDRKLNNYLKAQGIGRKDSYYGGRTIWVHEFGQSYELKNAYAYAYAQTLRDAGIKAYAGSRLD